MAANRKLKSASPWIWVGGLLFAILAVVAMYVAALVYPAPLFAYNRRTGGFRMYSDQEPSVDIDRLAAEVTERLAQFERAPEGRTYTVYLCHSLRRYAIFAKLARRTVSSQAIGLSVPGNIFVSMPRLAQLASQQGETLAHSRFEGRPAFAIAHEIAHFAIGESPGRDTDRSLPTWKSEGWADYQANVAKIRGDPDYDLARRIDLLDDPRYWQEPRLRNRRFYKWQLLVEYLAAERGYRFEDLIRSSVTEIETETQMRAWRREVDQPAANAARQESD